MCTFKNALQSRDPNKHNDITEKSSYIKLNSETVQERQARRQIKCYRLGSGGNPSSAQSQNRDVKSQRVSTEQNSWTQVPPHPRHQLAETSSPQQTPLPILAKKDRLVPTAKTPHCDLGPGSGGSNVPLLPQGETPESRGHYSRAQSGYTAPESTGLRERENQAQLRPVRSF